MKFKRAFTLIELLLVIAIVAIIFAFSAPYTLRFYNTQLINETQSNILSVLSQARHNALLQKNDSDWGVKFDSENNQYILFQGSSYAENVDLYDEVYPLLNNIELTGDWTDEIVFSKYTGVPTVNGETTFGTTTLAYESMTRQIFIDEDGLISNVVSEVSGGGGDTDEAAIVADLREGLFAYYPLDNDVNDDLGNYNGNNGGATPTTGRVNGGYAFDGTQYIETFDIGMVNTQTVSAWVKINSRPSSENIIVGGGWDFNTLGMLVYTDSAFGTFVCPEWNTCNYIYSNSNYDLDTWYYLTTTYNSETETLSFYVDGIFQQSIVSPRLNDWGFTFGLGARNPGWTGEFLNGKLDEVAVWERVLEPEEIAQLCNDTGSGCVGRSLIQ
jgi:prepilin-type N-terminal cleavage/methylation domain-containing protein